MKCNIARDLLPLYFDGLCSEETRRQLEEHMEQCENCKELKRSLEPEQDWSGANPVRDKAIVPFKKVKRKMRRKNIAITVCFLFIFLLAGVTALLTYGQITKTGYSFELVYDALWCRYIGKQFASGNIEPLYDMLFNGYILQDEESAAVRLAYPDNESYDEDMKKAILEKYHQYFDGKNLTYQGIEEIGYEADFRTGWNRTLCVSLKFTGEEQTEYYILLYKSLGGKYLAGDYFGNPYFMYTAADTESRDEGETGREESYHTEDTLFSCLPNRIKDADVCMMRYTVLVSGQRALQGDTLFAERGQMRFALLSEEDLKNDTYNLCEEWNGKLAELAQQGYYLTDIIYNVKEYDKSRRLYKYRVNFELTNETDLGEAIVELDCYRVSDKFVYIPGTDRIYGPSEVVQALESLL